MRRWALAGLLFALEAGAQVGRPDDVFDRIVAVVGQEVITQTDVDVTAQIQLVRLGRAERLAFARAPEIRNKALEYLVAQTLIHEEARRLAFQQIRREDVQNELAAFRGKFSSPAEYQRFLAANGMSEDDLAERFGRTLLSNRFAEDNVRLNVQVRPTDVDAFVERNRDTELFQHKKPEEMRELARRILFRERFDKALSEWIAALRRRINPRILVTYR